MKRKLLHLFYSLLIMIMITVSSSCTVALVSKRTPGYLHRNVWVNRVYYEQVYYIKDGKTIIIAQKKIPGNKNKPHHDNGNHKSEDNY